MPNINNLKVKLMLKLTIDRQTKRQEGPKQYAPNLSMLGVCYALLCFMTCLISDVSCSHNMTEVNIQFLNKLDFTL